MSARIIYSANAADAGTITIPEDVDYLVLQLVDNYYYRNSSENINYANNPSFPDEGFKVTRGQSIYLPVTKEGTTDAHYITATFNEDGTLTISPCGSDYHAHFNVSGYAYEEVEPPVSVTLDRESFVLPKGGGLPLHAVSRPSYARPFKANWSVVPTGIVGVPEGAVNTASVEAAADGTAVVRASAGDKYAECGLTVRGTDVTIKTALTDGTDDSTWIYGSEIQSIFMPLTVKKTGLTLYKLSFDTYVGNAVPVMKFELKKYGADEVLLSASTRIEKTNSTDSTGTFAFYLHYPLEKDVEYQLCFSSESGFDRPLVVASYVEASDYVDISTGSAYYNDENTALFAGIIGLIEEV